MDRRLRGPGRLRRDVDLQRPLLAADAVTADPVNVGFRVGEIDEFPGPGTGSSEPLREASWSPRLLSRLRLR